MNRLRVGRLVKAHGLKGALKLELYTDEPEKRFVPGAIFSLQVLKDSPWFGKTIEFSELRWYNQSPVGFFKDIDDRDQAETLVKAILWIEFDPNEVSSEEDAWYDHQLIGLKVFRRGERIGELTRVDHLPAQDLLIITTLDGKEVMLPFVKALVPEVNLAQGRIIVAPPMGLFEDIEEDTAANDAEAESAALAAATQAALDAAAEFAEQNPGAFADADADSGQEQTAKE
ncbi:MAG: ribosome maturation factor RimM [Microbacteriaceae bacterium]